MTNFTITTIKFVKIVCNVDNVCFTSVCRKNESCLSVTNTLQQVYSSFRALHQIMANIRKIGADGCRVCRRHTAARKASLHFRAGLLANLAASCSATAKTRKRPRVRIDSLEIKRDVAWRDKTERHLIDYSVLVIESLVGQSNARTVDT